MVATPQALSVLGSQCHCYYYNCACGLHHTIPIGHPQGQVSSPAPVVSGSISFSPPALAAVVDHALSRLLRPYVLAPVHRWPSPAFPPASSGTSGYVGGFLLLPESEDRLGLVHIRKTGRRELITLFPRTLNLGIFS